MKELVLDLNVWKCGDDETTFGNGDTALENHEGFKCCLGQFSRQLNPDCNILNKGEPKDVDILIDKLNTRDPDFNYLIINNTEFSIDAMDINDGMAPIKEKISKLRKLCRKNGFKLTTKNDQLFDSRGKLKNKQLLKNEIYYDIFDIESDIKKDCLSKQHFVRDRHFWRQYVKKRGWDKSKKFLKKLIKEINNE